MKNNFSGKNRNIRQKGLIRLKVNPKSIRRDYFKLGINFEFNNSCLNTRAKDSIQVKVTFNLYVVYYKNLILPCNTVLEISLSLHVETCYAPMSNECFKRIDHFKI